MKDINLKGQRNVGTLQFVRCWRLYTNQNHGEPMSKKDEERNKRILMERRGRSGDNAAAARERGRTCCLAAGVVIDEVAERASPKCRVSSGGQPRVGRRSECNQRGDAESESTTTTFCEVFEHTVPCLQCHCTQSIISSH